MCVASRKTAGANKTTWRAAATSYSAPASAACAAPQALGRGARLRVDTSVCRVPEGDKDPLVCYRTIGLAGTSVLILGELRTLDPLLTVPCRRSHIESVLGSSWASSASPFPASCCSSLYKVIPVEDLDMELALPPALDASWKCRLCASSASSSGVLYMGSRIRFKERSLLCPAYRTWGSHRHSSPPSRESTNSSSTITSLTLRGTTG
mmetsp:Transcript_43065/g.100003  ORF Transcript_43065/g.100003 Transcript_43065/m.100003 type:complete len:208 (-) Transcript_43065:414-1037(-)